MKKTSEKRMQTLKSLMEAKLELQQGTTNSNQPAPPEKQVTPPGNNVRMIAFSGSKQSGVTQHLTDLSKPNAIFHKLISKEISNVAKTLRIEEEELQAWVDLQIEVPPKTILSLLRTAQDCVLDPFKEEIGFTQYEDGHWQVQITIEGWMHLLNQHPQFNGMTFAQGEAGSNTIPEWMECSIYRKDRIFPMTVREYFQEVKTEQPIWQKMPRRMLRHRALQQCARLAMGI